MIVSGMVRVTTGGPKDRPAELHMKCETCINRLKAITSPHGHEVLGLAVPICFKFEKIEQFLQKGGYQEMCYGECTRYNKPFTEIDLFENISDESTTM